MDDAVNATQAMETDERAEGPRTDGPLGTLYVFSGPSGVGKGTVLGRVLAERDGMAQSVSATTRSPREGEVDGVSYHFMDRAEFEERIGDGDFLEWAEYAGNLYGTPRSYVTSRLEAGEDVLLEIDVQGALQVKRSMPECVLAFIEPPSLDELRSRLEGRGTEDEETISKRMAAARMELGSKEEYDIVFVNDRVDDTVAEIRGFMESRSGDHR